MRPSNSFARQELMEPAKWQRLERPLMKPAEQSSQAPIAGRCDLLVEGPYAVSSVPIVALVGRPNVGKSSLFNRLVGKRQAIVDAEPGVTRDRLYAPLEWAGRNLTVVDTGGIDTESEADIPAQMRAQAELAIEQADVVMFVVDAKEGVTPGCRICAHSRKTSIADRKNFLRPHGGGMQLSRPSGIGSANNLAVVCGRLW